MNVNLYVIEDYENETAFRPQKNKPNSNPIKPNFTYPQRHALSYAEGGKTEVRCAPLRSAHWLKCRNKDASKKIFVATGILVFDFELFIGDRF